MPFGPKDFDYKGFYTSKKIPPLLDDNGNIKDMFTISVEEDLKISALFEKASTIRKDAEKLKSTMEW